MFVYCEDCAAHTAGIEYRDCRAWAMDHSTITGHFEFRYTLKALV